MFKVYINDQAAEYPLYEPLDETLRIFNPVLTQEMGQAGYFQFAIMAGHPHADKIGLLKSEVIVYDDEAEVFHGRVLKPEYSMQNVITVTCEGDLTYLIDSQQRPFEFSGSIVDFISHVLTAHNEQVDEFKRIYPGRITVTDTTGNDDRSSTTFVSTQELLFSKLVDIHGGYLRIRNEGGIKYLDYLWDYGGINDQVIRFGENLLNLDRYMDATAIITCLIPLGADVEYTDELGEKQVRTVDIAPVNQGNDYIQNDEAIAKYGKVWGANTWKDVTDPENLLAKARAYLQEASALPVTMEVTAVDLSLLDENVQEFRLGYWTQVSSEPHGIEKQFMLTKRVINLLDPTAGSITLGRATNTLTGNNKKVQSSTAKAIEKVAESSSAEINRKVENATNLITGGLGGYVVLDNIDPNTGEKIHPWRILIMNTPDKDTAQNVIQFNQNGIGFSTTGINGPYSNAWTIDGNLVADFITTGTMLADRIRGGTLEVGGSGIGRDGRIDVKDVNDKVIGYWDKTGLHIFKGVIEGTNIIGSHIEGTYISGSEIDVGPFSVSEDIVRVGNFYVSNLNNRNTIQSDDGSIIISQRRPQTTYFLKVGDSVRVTQDGHLRVDSDIFMKTSYMNGWGVSQTLEWLEGKINNLQRQMDNL